MVYGGGASEISCALAVNEAADKVHFNHAVSIVPCYYYHHAYNNGNVLIERFLPPSIVPLSGAVRHAGIC